MRHNHPETLKKYSPLVFFPSNVTNCGCCGWELLPGRRLNDSAIDESDGDRLGAPLGTESSSDSLRMKRLFESTLDIALTIAHFCTRITLNLSPNAPLSLSTDTV